MGTYSQDQRRTRSSGFTLVEILVVVMVLGISVMLVVENLTNFKRRNELSAGATSLSRFLDSAPAWAKDQNTSVDQKLLSSSQKYYRQNHQTHLPHKETWPDTD